MAFSNRHLFVIYVFVAVMMKWAEATSDLTLLQFPPEKEMQVGTGEQHVLPCGVSDPEVYVAWYRASQQQLLLWRITPWSRQNSTYVLRNASAENHDGLYVCQIDVKDDKEADQSYTLELTVVDGLRTGPTGRTAVTATTGSNVKSTLNVGATPEPPTQANQTNNNDLMVPLLVAVVVLQLVCLSMIFAILIFYLRLRPADGKEMAEMKQESIFVDIEAAPNGKAGGTVRFRMDTETPPVDTTTTGNRTFKLRSKSMMHPRRKTADEEEEEIKQKSLTSKKKKNGTAVKPDKIIFRKSKSVASRHPSSKRSSQVDDEEDLSPSIVPLGKTRSFSLRDRPMSDDGTGFLPLSPDVTSIGPLINDPDADPVQWDTYNSLMESMTSRTFKKEKTKAERAQMKSTKKKKKLEKKQRQSEIDAFVQDDEYWKEVRSSTPKRGRSARVKGAPHPGAARRVNSNEMPFPKTSVQETSFPSYQKRHSIDSGQPHADLQRYPTGKAARVLINPAIQEDIQDFTPNLVRRLKNMYDQGITTIEIT
eukprot:m.11329 g.11329  ORF g.11329 m.11329 type:complete len:535 (+) comp23175_c0_seq1:217-1821(+)